MAAGRGPRASAGGRCCAPGRWAEFPAFALFAQEDLSFETLIALGSAGYGRSEVGEIVTAVNEINARGAFCQAYFESFRAMAQRLSALAGSELAAGHKISARSAYLRAATYHDVSPTWTPTASPSLSGACGESVVRAAAYEHRLAAVVADPGVRNAWLAFPAFQQKLFQGGASKAEVNHIWNTEIAPQTRNQVVFDWLDGIPG